MKMLCVYRAAKPPPGTHLDVMKGDKLVQVLQSALYDIYVGFVENMDSLWKV